jgi:hypothetical protein
MLFSSPRQFPANGQREGALEKTRAKKDPAMSRVENRD